MDQNQLRSVSDDPIQREIEKLDETNKKQEWRIQILEAKAVQNINLYFVFQAVILASSSTANCHNWWIPAILSVLTATYNLFTFCASMNKVVKSREELDQNMVDLAFMKVYQMTKAQINQVLPGTPLNHQRGEIVRPMPSSARRWRRRLLVCFSVGLFIGFSSVVMYGCYTRSCHPGDGKRVKDYEQIAKWSFQKVHSLWLEIFQIFYIYISRRSEISPATKSGPSGNSTLLYKEKI